MIMIMKNKLRFFSNKNDYNSEMIYFHGPMFK